MTYRNRISQAALAAITFGALSVSVFAQSPLPPQSWAARAEMNQSAQVAQDAVTSGALSASADAQAHLPAEVYLDPHAWLARDDQGRWPVPEDTQIAELDRQGNEQDVIVAQPTPASEAPWYA